MGARHLAQRTVISRWSICRYPSLYQHLAGDGSVAGISSVAIGFLSATSPELLRILILLTEPFKSTKSSSKDFRTKLENIQTRATTIELTTVAALSFNSRLFL